MYQILIPVIYVVGVFAVITALKCTSWFVGSDDSDGFVLVWFLALLWPLLLAGACVALPCIGVDWISTLLARTLRRKFHKPSGVCLDKDPT